MNRLNKLSFDQIPVTTQENSYATNQTIDMDCNAFLFINQGTNVVMIGQTVKLLPNGVYGLGLNIGERLIRQYQFQFVDTGGTNDLVVALKVYV